MGPPDQDRFRGLPIGVLALDAGQVVTACDDVFCATFACATADVLGRSLDDLFSPRDRRASLEYATKMSRFTGGVLDLLVTLRLGGKDHAARLRVCLRDGGFAAFAEPAFGADNVLYRFTAIEQRWRGTVRSSADGIVILDEGGRIVEHNARFFSLMGFRDAHGVSLSEDAVVGRKLLDLVQASFAGLAEFLARPEDELTTRSVEASRCLELKAMPMTLATGARLGTFVMVRDITEELQVAARDAIIRDNLLHARAFQRAILTAPPAVPGHHVDVAYQPLDVVGGDIYDVTLLGDVVRLFIADATGHGVPAALVTMLLKSAYEFVKDTKAGPETVLALLNDRVARAHGALDAMCTAAVVDVDLKTREATYSCGAHPGPLLVNDGAVEELSSGGTFVGVDAGRTFPRWKRQLAKEDGLYLVTDGISESRRADGEHFGDARLHRALAEANELREGASDAVLMRLEAWLRPNALDDDATIVALRPERPGVPVTESGRYAPFRG
ncbi:MAG: SpoIIE family protein phosphatase [Labilithrix sp.]|nr:SpoIIE family protein phosphatase [Labilithrix sp.]MCW5815374.1 SpoIIE family protein phosphatase [Labilithrix sp.]